MRIDDQRPKRSHAADAVFVVQDEARFAAIGEDMPVGRLGPGGNAVDRADDGNEFAAGEVGFERS